MKILSKLIGFFAGLFLVAGIVLFAVGWIGGGKDAVLGAILISEEDFTYREHTVEGDAASISLEASVNSIAFEPSEDGAVHIRYWLYEKDVETFEEKDGSVTFKVKRESEWVTQILPLQIYPAEKRLITVALPEEFPGQLAAKTDVGDISVTGISLAALTLESSTGRISVKEVNAAADLCLKSDTGFLECAGVRAEEIELSAKVGSIRVEDVVVSGKLSLDSDTGTIRAEQAAAAECLVRSNVGALELNDIVSDHIDCHTDTGSIRLKVTGSQADYRIEMDANVGSAQVDGVSVGSGILNPEGEKLILAHSNVGSIDIRFQPG